MSRIKSLSQFDAENVLRIRLSNAEMALDLLLRAEAALAAISQQAVPAEQAVGDARDQFLEFVFAALEMSSEMEFVPSDLAERLARVSEAPMASLVVTA